MSAALGTVIASDEWPSTLAFEAGKKKVRLSHLSPNVAP